MKCRKETKTFPKDVDQIPSDFRTYMGKIVMTIRGFHVLTMLLTVSTIGGNIHKNIAKIYGHEFMSNAIKKCLKEYKEWYFLEKRTRSQYFGYYTLLLSTKEVKHMVCLYRNIMMAVHRISHNIMHNAMF